MRAHDHSKCRRRTVANLLRRRYLLQVEMCADDSLEMVRAEVGRRITFAHGPSQPRQNVNTSHQLSGHRISKTELRHHELYKKETPCLFEFLVTTHLGQRSPHTVYAPSTLSSTSRPSLINHHSICASTTPTSPSSPRLYLSPYRSRAHRNHANSFNVRNRMLLSMLTAVPPLLHHRNLQL